MGDPSGTASDFFGAIVGSYDSLIRRAVPRYAEMTDQLLTFLPPTASHILELGCGTGNLTLRLLDRFPQARITAVDAAPQMTEVTAIRASRAGQGQRVRTITARFEDLALPPTFDLVTSCLSLHHVADKAALYGFIRRALSHSGAFCFADQFLGATPEIQRAHWDGWLAFCRQPGHCTEEEIRTLEAHAAAHDHYVPLAEHFRLLALAGFVNCDCTWRNRMYAVVTADAPAS